MVFVAGLNIVTMLFETFAKIFFFCRTVDSSSTRMSGAAGGYQCRDDNDGDL